MPPASTIRTERNQVVMARREMKLRLALPTLLVASSLLTWVQADLGLTRHTLLGYGPMGCRDVLPLFQRRCLTTPCQDLVVNGSATVPWLHDRLVADHLPAPPAACGYLLQEGMGSRFIGLRNSLEGLF